MATHLKSFSNNCCLGFLRESLYWLLFFLFTFFMDHRVLFLFLSYFCYSYCWKITILNTTMWQLWKSDPSSFPRFCCCCCYLFAWCFFWTNSVKFVLFVMCGYWILLGYLTVHLIGERLPEVPWTNMFPQLLLSNSVCMLSHAFSDMVFTTMS